jgi:hypothetical protein
MKICFLAKTKGIHTERWINYFAEHGHEVTLITTRSNNKNLRINEKIDIRRIWFPPFSIARYGALLVRQLYLPHGDLIYWRILIF